MRVGVISTDNVQNSLMAEMLSPVFGEVRQYSLSHIHSGEFSATEVHLLVLDFSDAAVVESEEVLEVLGREEPVCVMNESKLYPMNPSERLAWRNKIVAEAKKSFPDFAEEIITPEESRAQESLHDIWLIGSSSGGPMALREFFSNLPALPITIVLVQHIALDAFKTFATMVQDSAKRWTVEPAVDGAPIRPGTIVAVPQDTYVGVSKGAIQVSQQVGQPTFNPSINATMRAIYKTTPGEFGVIILTGMGDDGAAGVKELQGNTLAVMAQDSESCAAKSMPEAARRTGFVTLSAPPAALASALAKRYGVGVL